MSRQVGLLLAMVVASVGCGETYFLMHEEYMRERDEEERYMGGGCSGLSDGVTSGSGSGGSDFSFSVEHRGTAHGVLVIVRSGRAVLAHREYDERFLLSDAVDEIEVDLTTQHHLRLKYWGDDQCEPVREPDSI